MKAIFPGSFDPITYGHLDIIERGAKLFDELIVVISNNTHKDSLFTPQKRYELAVEATKNIKNVTVKLVQSDLTVNLLHQLGADVIIRGARNDQDFIFEQQIALMNKKMDPDAETLILFSSPDCCYISSSLIREIYLFKGKLAGVVPENVNQALQLKQEQEKK